MCHVFVEIVYFVKSSENGAMPEHLGLHLDSRGLMFPMYRSQRQG